MRNEMKYSVRRLVSLIFASPNSSVCVCIWALASRFFAFSRRLCGHLQSFSFQHFDTFLRNSGISLKQNEKTLIKLRTKWLTGAHLIDSFARFVPFIISLSLILIARKALLPKMRATKKWVSSFDAPKIEVKNYECEIEKRKTTPFEWHFSYCQINWPLIDWIMKIGWASARANSEFNRPTSSRSNYRYNNRSPNAQNMNSR